MKKVVLKVGMHDDKCKKKAMTRVSRLAGVESIDIKDGKLTVTGNVDPVEVADKLRKIFCDAEIESVGPAKEEKKPEAPKPQKEDPPKKDPKDEWAALLQKTYGYPPPPFYYRPPPMYGGYYCIPVEEDPNGCVIC